MNGIIWFAIGNIVGALICRYLLGIVSAEMMSGELFMCGLFLAYSLAQKAYTELKFQLKK